jgi:Fe2+ or Zn2+ uptake regulation protein
MTNYVNILKSSGLKATLQRLSILEIIDKNGHIKIDDLYQEMFQTHPTLSLATVYKNIITMIDKDVILEVPIIGGKSFFELKKIDHIHLICNSCNSIEDRDMVTSTMDFLSPSKEFLLSHSQVNLYGTCSSCQN